MNQPLKTRLRGNKKVLLIVGACLYFTAIGLYGFWAHRKIGQWSQVRAERIGVSPKVYVTPEGKKYHRWHHYRERGQQISLYEAKEQGFEHCKICFRNPDYDSSILIMSPLPWPMAHWLALIIALTVIVSAVGLFGSRIAYPTRIVALSMVTTVPVFLMFVGFLCLVSRQIDKLPRYVAGLILGASAVAYAVLLLWKRGFRLRS